METMVSIRVQTVNRSSSHFLVKSTWPLYSTTTPTNIQKNQLFIFLLFQACFTKMLSNSRVKQTCQSCIALIHATCNASPWGISDLSQAHVAASSWDLRREREYMGLWDDSSSWWFLSANKIDREYYTCATLQMMPRALQVYRRSFRGELGLE